MLLLISAEIVTQLMSAIPVPLVAASAPVTGIGLVLAGTALLRSAAASRMRGLAAILVGGYAIAVIVPTSLGAGGANYLVVAGWGVCWALPGVSLMAAALHTDPTAAPIVTTSRLATGVKAPAPRREPAAGQSSDRAKLITGYRTVSSPHPRRKPRSVDRLAE